MIAGSSDDEHDSGVQVMMNMIAGFEYEEHDSGV